MDTMKYILTQLPYLFLQPMLYIGILLLILQYKRQIALERKLFSSRIHTLSLEIFRSIGYGLIGGIIASTLMILLGIVFHPTEMWIVWLITGILILFHIRFLCLSYSVSILGTFVGIIQIFVSQLTPFMRTIPFPYLSSIYKTLLQIHVPSLIAIVAILHLIEAILIKLQGEKEATPLFFETKRGKLVGGFHLQSFWMLPLFLVVSSAGMDAGFQFHASWWPLIGASSGSITLIPVPAMIGFSDMTSVYTPKEKSNKIFINLFIYSILLLAFAFIAEHMSSFIIAAALFTGFGHETVRFIGERQEKKRLPLYIHPNDGIRVLSILPGSLAEQMGIKSSEIIKKVNGITVTNRKELYSALQRQSAFVRLEVINLDGHIKFVQHSIYSGEHHQLGIILSPDDDAPFYIDVYKINLFQLLVQKLQKVSRGA